MTTVTKQYTGMRRPLGLAAICAGALSDVIDARDATVEGMGLMMGGASLEASRAEA